MSKPQPGTQVVWRFKGNKGWTVSYVRELMANGKVVRLCESQYSSGDSGSVVAVADIDWHIK